MRNSSMARSRKGQTVALRVGAALKAVLLCVFIGGSGMGYVWQKNQIYHLGQRIRLREQRLDQLQAQNHELARHRAILCSPRELDARVRKLNLGLGPTQPQQ